MQLILSSKPLCSCSNSLQKCSLSITVVTNCRAISYSLDVLGHVRMPFMCPEDCHHFDINGSATHRYALPPSNMNRSHPQQRTLGRTSPDFVYHQECKLPSNQDLFNQNTAGAHLYAPAGLGLDGSFSDETSAGTSVRGRRKRMMLGSVS